MKTNDSAWMQPVLDVVKETDPELFAKIDAAGWTVTVIDMPDDLDYLLDNPQVNFISFMGLAYSLADANGVTVMNVPEMEEPLRGNTWLNRPYIEFQAQSLHVDPVRFAAFTLVHEYAHHAGADNEEPAYAAGRAFAVKMGEPAIVRSSDDTLAVVQRERTR
jgi:hypothetical protein